ncbi:MAG: O-antigen ligase family protein, partial [Clostridia bacterium]|nr:O-antigen ligase family protein [Clostridia bacterium]
VLRGKRSIHPEPLDIMVTGFAVILFFGGTVSLSAGSLKPALLFVCFLLGYFEVVWLLRERDWLAGCASAGVISASLVSLYGILQYLTGTSVMAEAWVDSEMFESIGDRAVGTLENPNMLGEYLILMLPLAAVMLVGHGEGLRRIPAFVCMGLMGCCLILTWSRGAWLGLIFAVVLFLFVWHRRAVWLLFAGAASIPILPYILPETIIQRFTSIGNLSDSSTSYRMHIWRASSAMLRDFGFSGIGIGESAWFRVYPKYAYMGVETAPHSHNLFLQIWLETGICGLAVFILILFLLFQSVFTMCRELREAKGLAVLDLRYGEGDTSSGSAYNRLIRRTRSQLRISCAAPLAGLAAVLVQGMTDYAWYNYRVYLMFWLMVGLTSAFVRSGRSMRIEPPENEEDRAALDLPYLAGKRGRKKPAETADDTAAAAESGKETI